MTRVNVSVQADDGYFYSHPQIIGETPNGQWFVVFDDDDPTELVFEENVKIDEVPLKFKVLSRPTKCGRGKFCVEIEVLEAIPAKLIRTSSGRHAEPKPGVVFRFPE